MRPVLVVVTNVFLQHAFQVPFIQDDYVVEQVPTVAADPSFCNTVLPWASEAGPLRLNAEALYRIDHIFVEIRAAIKDQVSGRGVERKRLAQLLNNPGARGMFGHIAMENSAPIMRNNKKH